MRTVLLFVLALGAITFKAQQFNLSYHEGKENSYGAVTIGSALYYLEHSQKLETCCTTELNLVKVRDGGQVIFRKKVGQWGYPSPPLISLSADNHLVVVDGTIRKYCDTGHVDYSVFKVDTSGTVLWEKKLAYAVSYLLPLGDSSIVLVYNDAMNKWNMHGSFTGSVSATSSSIWSMCPYGKNNFLLNYKNGGQSYLKKYSNGLQGSAPVPIALTLDKMALFKDSSLLGMSFGVLRRYSKSFTWQGNSDVNIPLHYSFQDFCINNDSVYCIGRSNWMAFYITVSKNLVPLHTSVSNLPHTNPTAISLVNNRVNILGTGRSYLTGTNPFIDVFQISKSGSISAVHDAGITSFTVIRAELLYANVALFEANVTVKNYGSLTVHSFHINNSWLGELNDCVAGLNKTFSLTIIPGESLTVSTGTFMQYINGVQYPPNFIMNLCLYTTVPNEQSDANILNDERCSQIAVTGSQEIQGSSQFNIFPNPGRDRFTIEGAVPISGIEIVDLTGRLLVKVDNKDKTTCEVSHDLPSGVYLLRVHSGGQVVTTKVVVE